jgi:O-antigen chain-terminating methyltransferase
VGSGRGEWLEVLRDEGHVAEGSEPNEALAQQCRAQGLVVHARGGVAHLRGCGDASHGAITLIHVVEHLPLEQLVTLLDECHRTLATRGALVIETPNPYNVWTSAVDFWRDPSHLHPMHPETLAMLLQAVGFSDVTLCGLTPSAGERALEPLHAPGRATHADWISSPSDYAVIARRP